MAQYGVNAPTKGSLLQRPNFGLMPNADDWGNVPQPSVASPALSGIQLDGKYAIGGIPGGPNIKGSWMDKANAVAAIGEVGLGVYNALEQAKMNKFMKSYYGDMMSLQRTDFENAAKTTNEALVARQDRVQSAKGIASGTAESQAGINTHMEKWGVKETF